MRHITRLIATCAALATSVIAYSGSVMADEQNEARTIVGYVENIYIPAVDLKMKAKLDTGAYTSSLHATIIEVRPPEEEEEEAPAAEESDKPADAKPSDKKPKKKRRKHHKETVIFKLEMNDPGNEGGEIRTKQLKYPVERWVKIKSKAGGHIRRPVIRMGFCIAGVMVEEEVNLADRDRFNYSALIGRNMLIGAKFAVDPSKAFTARPNCPTKQDNSEEDNVIPDAVAE